MAVNLFYFFIFPGLLFLAVAGAFLSWFDRKISARVQFRKGPPLLQPFYDFFKLLLVKETILPRVWVTFCFPPCPGAGCIRCNDGRGIYPPSLFQNRYRFQG